MIETAKIKAICNQKGGVGKTVTAVNLGIGLAREGKRAFWWTWIAKGAGYERCAKIINLKEAAKTHNFLIENDLTDYGELA